MNDTPNPAMLKLAAAAVGGYVLGRFKKGRAAISFAMWMAGAKDPKAMLRDGLLSAAQTPEAQQLFMQLRGPALEAGRRVAAATFENQIGALTSALEQRTKALTAGTEEDEDDESAEGRGEVTDLATRKKRRKKVRARDEERPADDEDEPVDADEAEAADTEDYDEEPEEDEAEAEDYEDEAEEDEPEEEPADEADADTEEDEEEDEPEAAPERRRPRKAAASARKAAPPARRKAAPARESSQSARKAKATQPSDDEPPKTRSAKRSAPAGRAPRRNRTEGARA